MKTQQFILSSHVSTPGRLWLTRTKEYIQQSCEILTFIDNHLLIIIFKEKDQFMTAIVIKLGAL